MYLKERIDWDSLHTFFGRIARLQNHPENVSFLRVSFTDYFRIHATIIVHTRATIFKICAKHVKRFL